jgi:hypothetical protein
MYFRLHPAVCAAAPGIFMRGRECAPKTDAWVWLALHAYTSQLPREQRHYVLESDLPCVTVPYRAGKVLAMLRGERSSHAETYTGNEWRDLSGALNRLEKIEPAFPISVRGGSKHTRFSGPLVQRTASEKSVTLRACPPKSGNYFVLLPYSVFELRPALGETATATLLRFSYLHRGRKARTPGARLQHNWRFAVNKAELDDHGLLRFGRGRVGEAWKRLLGALEELSDVQVLSFKLDDEVAQIVLAQDFFHCEEETT